MKKYLILFLILSAGAKAQQLAPLTVQKIMRDPKWMGVAPTNYRWAGDSKTVFFNWNPENKEKDLAYKVSVLNNKPEVTEDNAAQKAAEKNYTYNKDKSLGLSEKGGDIYLFNFKTNKETRLTNTVDREMGSYFLYNNDVIFQRGDNLFQVSLSTAEMKQLTNFIKGKRPTLGVPQVGGAPIRTMATVQDNWLKTDQTELFDIIKKRNKQGATGAQSMAAGRRFGLGGSTADAIQRAIKPIYLEDRFLSSLKVSPDGNYISYRLYWL